GSATAASDSSTVRRMCRNSRRPVSLSRWGARSPMASTTTPRAPSRAASKIWSRTGRSGSSRRPRGLRIIPISSRPRSGARLEDRRHALTLAEGEGRHTKLRPFVEHPVEQGRREPGARGAEGVADGDRPTPGVDPLLVDAEQLEYAQDLDGERLIDLDALDLIERHAGPLQRLVDRPHGADAHL